MTFNFFGGITTARVGEWAAKQYAASLDKEQA